MSSLIIDPEYAKLLEEYIQLKAQLAEVFEQRADLVYHEANRWQTEYMLKIVRIPVNSDRHSGSIQSCVQVQFSQAVPIQSRQPNPVLCRHLTKC